MKVKVVVVALSDVVFSLCIASAAVAVEVYSTTRAWQHRQSVRIEGSGFGAHADNSPNDPSTLSVKFDDFENGVNGQPVQNGWFCDGTRPVYTNQNQRTGSGLSSYHHFHDNIYRCFIGLADLGATEIYMSYWRRLDLTYLIDPKNFKELRFHGTNARENPMITWGVNAAPAPGQDLTVAFYADEAAGTCWQGGLYRNGYWDRRELWIRIGDNPGQRFKLWENAQQIVNYASPSDFPGGSGPYLGDDGTFQYFGLGFYLRSGSDGVTQFDNVYIDNTQARVEIGNAVTWTGCTHREIQNPTAWSDTSVSVTVSQGSFLNGSKAYIYVIDANGNVNSQGFAITLGEAPIADLTPPFVSGQSPSPNAQNVPVNSSVVLHVQDSGDGVDVASIAVKVNGAAVTPQITGTSSDYTVTDVAASPFAYNATVTVTVNARDLHSPPNVMSEAAYSFKTAAGDTDPPFVTGQSPTPNAQNVPVNSSVVLHVQDSGDGVDKGSIALKVNGIAVTPQITGTSSDYTVSYVPASPFPYNSTVAVAVNARDLHSPPNVMSEVAYSFKTTAGDTAPPTVTGQSPAPSAQNVAVTSKVVLHVADSGDGVNVGSISMKVNGVRATPLITGPPSDYTVTYTPASPFPYGASVTVTVNAQDLHTPPNVMTQVAYSFTTQPEGAITEEWGDGASSNHPGTVQDTYINLNSENYSSDATSLNAYTWPANSRANAIVVKFDLSAIPTNAVVTSAKLYLYLFEAGGDATYEISVQKVINVNPVISGATGYTCDGTNPWTPYQGLYDNVPLGQSDIAAADDTIAIDTALGYKEWTVTEMVAAWVANPANNRGLMLNSDPTAAADAHRFFRPSEYSDASQRPRLVISYTVGSPPPPPGAPGKPVHVD